VAVAAPCTDIQAEADSMVLADRRSVQMKKGVAVEGAEIEGFEDLVEELMGLCVLFAVQAKETN
jgi:hypothetical protein